MNRYQTTFNSWNKVAAAYQEIFMDLELYNDTYDAFCNLVEKPEAKIFEIGCGPGNITKYLLTKRPDFNIFGIDVAPNMIRLAKQNNPAADFAVMDCREINTVTDTFDGIMCGFCLPYLSKEDVARLVTDSANLLNSSGIFYLSTIEGDYARSGFETGSTGDKMYVYYYSENFIKQLLTDAGFEVVTMFRKPYQRADGPSTHLIFNARKK